jgi:uncharacterized protein DUF1566/type IX secretion system substrate protein
MNDWRLPNIRELQSINDESLINPSLDTNFFSTTGQNKYWSSTTLPNQTTKAWYLDTTFGITTYDSKTFKHYGICVRGNQNNASSINQVENTPLNAKAYPNPFQNSTTISFVLPSTESVNIKVYDLYGQLISTLHRELMIKGEHKIIFDGSSWVSGIYIFIVQSGNQFIAAPPVQVLFITS